VILQSTSHRRWALLSLALVLGGCEESFFSVGDRWHTPRINEAYHDRDACMAKSAATEAPGAIDATAAARAVAEACASQTEKLVQISNRDGDSKVAGNIRDNSQFRAMGYVMRSRGQPVTTDVAQGSTGSVTPAR
jgi:peptidyl-tRNA hydrolase